MSSPGPERRTNESQSTLSLRGGSTTRSVNLLFSILNKIIPTPQKEGLTVIRRESSSNPHEH
jgi:hypothetical protein